MLSREENVRLAVLRAEMETYEAQVAAAKRELSVRETEANQLIQRKWEQEPLHNLAAEDKYQLLQQLQQELHAYAAWDYLENFIRLLSPLLENIGYEQHTMMPRFQIQLERDTDEAKLQQLAGSLTLWTEFVLRHQDDDSNEPFQQLYAQQTGGRHPRDEYLDYRMLTPRGEWLPYLRVWPNGEAVRVFPGNGTYKPDEIIDPSPRPLLELLKEAANRAPYPEEPPF